jgi:predicted nuclease of predicted toxin-antitoxin system
MRRDAVPWIDCPSVPTDGEPSDREARELQDQIRRKKKLRLYADHNFPKGVVETLRGMGADVVTAEESGTARHPDENHVAAAKRLGRVLLTCDRDFLNERLHPLIHCPAIVVFDFGSGSTGDIARTLRCLNYIWMVPVFYDKWVKLDANREGWTEYVRFQDGSTNKQRCRFHRGRLQVWQQ